MNYCALDDAFQTIGGAPSPGCALDYATKMARKEERRKAKKCKGPAATYFDMEDKDPDRQHLNPLPDVPAMNPALGMREHVPVTAPQGTTEPFTHHYTQTKDIPDQKIRNFDKDPLHNYLESEMSKHLIPVTVPSSEIFNPSSVGSSKKYFGSDPDGDMFADYQPDATNERLYSDFRSTFEQSGVARAGSVAASTLPNPSVNMFWKPVTKGGAQTSFVEHLPPPGGKYYRPKNQHGEISMDEVMKKMDKLFARLDDMNSSSPEQITSELLMFISSGIFVLFMMDLLVKKGSTLRF
jgi:hypothetical protein